MKELAELTSLKVLDLRDTKLTDDGLKELAGLKNLRILDLRGTKVTAAGRDRLKTSLPGCDIHVTVP